MSVLEALRRVILDENRETAVAALDWALNCGRIDLFDFEQLILDLPDHKRRIGTWADGRCESLPEILARTRLRRAGHSVEIQALVGSKRVDLVIDGTVGLEINGKQFHAHTFEEDHLKGIEITIAGFHGMSISAQMVFSQWGHSSKRWMSRSRRTRRTRRTRRPLHTLRALHARTAHLRKLRTFGEEHRSTPAFSRGSGPALAIFLNFRRGWAGITLRRKRWSHSE